MQNKFSSIYPVINLYKRRSVSSENGAPIVVKADGLAAGKGVSICKNVDEAKIITIVILVID